MTEEQAEAVARSLTQEQRDAVGHLSVKPWRFPQRWNVLVGYSLEKLGVSRRTFITNRTYLTSFGERVKAILERTNQ